MLQERSEGVGQHLVRTVADEHLFGRNPVVAGQGSPQCRGLRVRIKTQRIRRLAANRFQRARRGTKRTFIGVELDQLSVGPRAPKSVDFRVLSVKTPLRA